MSLPPSTLSTICRSIADFVGLGLNASGNSILVQIGTPAVAAAAVNGNNHRLNLFFFRVEPSGFFPETAPDDIWRTRIFCLVTPFAIAEDQVGPGENDLRLIGEVFRLFHETPILPELVLDSRQVRLEALYHPLSLDEMNHLWGTQGDVPYRLSAVYELSLVPVIPSRTGVGAPLVGAIGTEVYGRIEARHAPFTANGVVRQPEVVARRVDAALEDWAPVICLVYGGECVTSLSFSLASAALAAFTPQVWIAGGDDAAVTLLWESWDSSEGWRSAGSAQGAAASGEMLDPARASDATTVGCPMPFKDKAGQCVLYAQRSYLRGSDGSVLTVRSNPVLVNLYGGGP